MEFANVTFSAHFAGQPKPEISWYHNQRLISQHQSLQMRVRGDKAILTIVEATPEHKGEYWCRAVNSAGETYCKAKLEVIELSYEEKSKIGHERYAALQIQHAAELMKVKEKERSEKERKAHDEAMARLKVEREQRTIEREKELEDARKNVRKPKVATEKKKMEESAEKLEYKTPTERRVAQVYSGWKAPVQIEETYPELEPDEFAPNQIPGVKCFVQVSETSMKGEEVVRELAPQYFEDERVIDELTKIHQMLKNHVRVSEIWAMFRAGEFPLLQQPSIQTSLVKICEYIGHQRNVSIVLSKEVQEQAQKHPVGLKAFVRMMKHAKNLKTDVLFKDVIPREMGKWSSTTQELQKVNQMINQGIESEEIIAFCEAGKLPTLKRPETQQPLINIVEKHGHSVMVAQVLVEEAYRDARDERVLAQRAWQVVHEQELVEAQVAETTTAQELEPVHGRTEVQEAQDIITKPLDLVPTPAPEFASVEEEALPAWQTAQASQVHSELCVPGVKAIVNLASEGKIDLENVDLKPLEKTKFQKDMAKLNIELRKGVEMQEIMSMMKEGKFEALKLPEHQANLLEVADRFEKATVNRVLVQEAIHRQDRNVGVKSVIRTLETGKESMEQIIMDVSKEFGPSSEPVKEISAVGHLLQEGVKCDEVLTLIDTGMLPTLKKPQAQVPLVSLVAERGHLDSICEVLIAESVKEIPKPVSKPAAARMTEVKEMLKVAKAKAVDVKTFTHEMVPGVKAYVQMAQEEQVNIEEVVQRAPMREEVKKEMAKIGMMVKHGILAQDVMTLIETGEFPNLMKPEAQAHLMEVVEEFGFKAIVNKVMIEEAIQKSDKSIGVKAFLKMIQQPNINIEQILTEQLPQEFGLDKPEPVKEMAKVSMMMKEGVQAQEIIAMVETGKLPTLKKPETQLPLINVMERQGQSALVCQVLVEDSIKDIVQDLPKVDVAKISSVETLQRAAASQVDVRVTTPCSPDDCS